MSLDFACGLLLLLDVAVLIREGEKKYSFFGTPPKFYNELFPLSEDGSPCANPWRHSPLLEFFLQDAEAFFLSEKCCEPLVSGVWQEESEEETEYSLIASASYVEDVPVLLIRDISRDFANHKSILQKARKNLLKQKELYRSLIFYQQKSSYDTLTSLYNKETFMEILQTELCQNSFENFQGALFMLDLDNFKSINDTYGHLEGDNILRQVGHIFNNTLRKNDIVARYGGEEFIIFIPNTAATYAKCIAEKLRSSVSGYAFGIPDPITLSIGGTMFNGAETLESWIKRADELLYKAKRSGKNCVCFE